MIDTLLEELGLTKGEIVVYKTLLHTGETTTGKIIDRAQISSGKIYEILERLIKKGLVSYIMKEKTKYFSAASAHRIIDYLEEKEEELHRKKQQLVKELPTLLELQSTHEQGCETRLFSGFRGIETAIFEVLRFLNKKDCVLAMGIRSSKEKQYNLLWQRWHKQRISRNILCKALFSDKDTAYYHLFKTMKCTQVRVLETLTPSAIDIMKHYVMIFTYGNEPSCLLIKNEEIAQSFTSFFENLWEHAAEP